MSTSTPHRILIIDDNPSIHEDIRKILGARSPETQALEDLESELFESSPSRRPSIEVEVQSALQGAEGLARLEEALNRQIPYSLAFVDMRMPPGWDGIETIQRLWERDPRLQVVLCTAYSDYTWEDIVSKLRYSENLVILKKPFDNIELLQLAHALTRKWELANNHATSTAENPRSSSENAANIETAILAAAFKNLPELVTLRRKDSTEFIYSNLQHLSLGQGRSDRSEGLGFRAANTSLPLLPEKQPQSRVIEFAFQGTDYVLTVAATVPSEAKTSN